VQSETEIYTLADLVQKAEIEREDRIKNGLKHKDFKVYFEEQNLIIKIERNEQPLTEIDLERCRNSHELIEWILHIHQKDYNQDNLLSLILTILDDVCHVIFDKESKKLFIKDNILDWKNKKAVVNN